jgi:hypothetical protein
MDFVSLSRNQLIHPTGRIAKFPTDGITRNEPQAQFIAHQDNLARTDLYDL